MTAGRRFAELIGAGSADDFVVLARGTRSLGERQAALAVLARWKRERHPEWSEIAMYYSFLGERDQSIEALNHALRTRAPFMAGLKVVAWLDPLRDDPRFERMLRAMRFP